MFAYYRVVSNQYEFLYSGVHFLKKKKRFFDAFWFHKEPFCFRDYKKVIKEMVL